MANYCFTARENNNFFFAVVHYKPEAKKVVWNEKSVRTKLPRVSQKLIDSLAKYGIEYQEKPQRAFVVDKKNSAGLDMLRFLVSAGFKWEGQF